MSWSLFSEAGVPIPLEPALPPGYSGPLLPGARVLAQSSPEALIVVQELPVSAFLVRLNFVQLQKRTTLLTRLQRPVLQSRLQQEGNFSARLKDLGRVSLKKSQYGLWAVPEGDCLSRFEKSARCRSLDVVYPESALQELTPYFPRLEKTLDAFAAGRSAAITPRGVWATNALLQLEKELLACPFTPALREVYLENKIREGLLLQLHGAYSEDPGPQATYSAREVAAAYEVRSLILENPEKHYTIGELAHRGGLNEHTLKQVFKRVFGTGPFECLMEARMNRARDLLLHTDQPIKVISGLTGYKFLTSFITAFRKYFGYTPASLRRGGE